ncbi:GNAT family N-acetyltransferase [Streptomyces sp. SBST2-5]|uniref:GNAT family N-acetyltransferase n=1 Tax=Streptomyces composti TaxID=2720025 RepID=A0ABX1AHA1_9ACTN|nr:GNAT family N-acetyltransferase [Streptomyces composti]NJP53003.1 GNAT family N-acetyltransferase [Streptomyces composti]
MCVPFRRADRDQLTDLVNTHVAAVVPGVSVSVNTVLSDLERQPEGFITDPWVSERVTLVAEQRGSVVAGAHLLRCRPGPEVGESYRDSGEINWFVCRPPASFRPDALDAAELLTRACLARLARWKVRRVHADGALPAPVVYGLPRTWPHIRAVYEAAGFRHVGDTEVILLARVADLPHPEPVRGVTFRRTVGECGTRFTACADGRALGFIEVDTALARPERHLRADGLADIGDLHIDPAALGTGLEHRLLAHAAGWLRLCGADRLAAHLGEEETEMHGLLTGAGFIELTRTDRGWELRPARPGPAEAPQIPGRYRSG